MIKDSKNTSFVLICYIRRVIISIYMIDLVALVYKLVAPFFYHFINYQN